MIYLAGCVNWEQQSEFHHVQTQIEQPSYVCDTFFNTRASPLKFVNGGRCPPPPRSSLLCVGVNELEEIFPSKSRTNTNTIRCV